MAGKTSTSFSKDRPGPGRPPGVPNKATAAFKEVAAKLLTDADYQAALKRRLIRGTAGAVEVQLYHYAYGKPKETVVHEGLAAMKGLTDEQLRDRASALLERLGARTATKALEGV